jgi:hypothetical protein
MRKQLYDELMSISDDEFHRLCDDILVHHNPEYANLDSRGMHLFKNKPVRGTPDSIKLLPDSSIYAFQYTTSNEDSLKDKLPEDVEKVYKWEFGKDVRRVILCCNSRLKDDVIRECKNKCSEYGWELDLLGIDSLIAIIINSYDAKVKADKYFKFDVFSINLEFDLEYYTNNEYPLLATSEIKENYHKKLLKFDIFALELKAVSISDGTELDFTTK